MVTSSASADEVRRFCDEEGISINAYFTTAFGLALKSYTCSENAIFSTIYNGRSDTRLENSVSMLVKTFPVYFDAGPEKDVKDTMRDCQKYLLSAMSHDIFSFAEIKKAYDITADIFFAFQGETDRIAIIGGEEAELVELPGSRARADLGFDVVLDGNRILYDLEYDPAVYSKYTLRSLTHMVDRVVAQLMHAALVKDISFTDEDDIQKITNLHDSAFDVIERPAYRLLQDSAEKKPDLKALVATDRTLTYRELNGEANALGHVLTQKGAGPESIIAVLAERDSYAYVMRQGVLKSGGAFLPIDPEYPEDRIRFILEDSGAKILVTKRAVLEGRSEMFDSISESGIEIVCVEDAVKEGDKGNLNVDVPYEALAYVIYTSGSTGKPKGVMLTNKNLVNFVDDDEKNHEILGYTRRGHVSLAIAALTFDFSIMEEFVPIANGMTVVLATHDEIMNPVMLGKLMTDNGVDVMSCTPSYLMNMLDMGEFTDVFTDAVKALRSVDMGAEAFPPALFEKLKEINPDICIMNGYGPTEATISCTMQIIEDTENITIGIPNVNVHVATVDRDGQLQCLGALGEMVIMGDGVGRGYIGRDDLTKKNFIRLLDMPAYKSGDLVRIRENGDIEYHGRIDNQVKLRGLRVELGEIESVISTYPGIRSCIVIVIKKETEYLAAYFTADNNIDIEDLKAHLSSQLTAYMVPQAFTQLDEMPLTANGKIDKKALPEPGMEAEKIVPPENDRQKKILDILKGIIGDVPVGITTDLFAAGLSSLGCIRLCTILMNEFNVNFTLAQLFENKTVMDIEKLLDSESVEVFEQRKEYPLSMTQMGIFVESIHYKDTTVYNMPYLYELDKDIQMDKLKLAVEKVLKAHPYLSMTVGRNEEGDVYAIRSDEVRVEISSGSVLPSKEELIRPFDLTSGEPLCRIGLFDTSDGKYLFIDTHHLVSDGESFKIFMEDIDVAYKGMEPEMETYTGFEAALFEEKMRGSDKLTRARELYESILGGSQKVTLPPKETALDASFDGIYSLTGEVSAKEVTSFCDKYRLGLNAFFTVAMGLSLKACTGAEEAVFATIYNGRNDSRLSRSIGMFVKTIPVCLKAVPQMSVVKAVGECQSMLVKEMACDIYSFAEICRDYGLNSDVLFAYQGISEKDDKFLIGGKEAVENELVLEGTQSKSPFGLDINLEDDRVIYEFECDPAMYGRAAMERFYRLIDGVVKGLLTCETVGEVLSLGVVKELSAKSVASEEPEKEAAAAKETKHMGNGSVSKPSRQLELLEEQLLEIYRKVLKNDSFGLDDNFFEHGGTSLLAAKVMMAIMVKDYPVVYQDIFDEPTPRGLAAHVFAKMDEEWNEERCRKKLIAGKMRKVFLQKSMKRPSPTTCLSAWMV